jgi:hypothetical protein
LSRVRTRARARLRGAILGVIGALYILSIPWYRESDAEATTVFGFPDWVAVSIGCYLAIAVLNSIAWLLTDVSDGNEGDAELREPRS